MTNKHDDELNFAFESAISEQKDESAKTVVKKKSHKLRWTLLIILFVIIALMLAAVITWFVMYKQGESALIGGNSSAVIELPTNAGVEPSDEGKIVTYNKTKYKYNENITTALCMGVDKNALGTDYGVVGTAGQADAIYLIAMNTKTNKHKVIGISRDTMTDVGIYSSGGKYLRTENMQLCLSFAYGDGKHTSCANTQNAVQRLFYNLPISQYYAIDISAISVLNDKIGGVTVPEYTADGSKKTGGSITLYGNEAETYLRSRNIQELASNNNRMERQFNYIRAFASKVVEKSRSNLGLPLDLYNISVQYSSTNITASNITYLSTNMLTKGNFSLDFLKVQGKVVKGDNGYAQFVVDKDKLLELVLSVFYERVA